MPEKNNVMVLYVDDEESNLFLFKVSFQSRYNILTAISPAEGLEKLEKYHDRIIVVISDMRMPQMNGIEFIETAKNKFKNIFYYILTGYDYSEEIDQALKKDLIQNFFTKPFDTGEINQAIEHAIRHFD